MQISESISLPENKNLKENNGVKSASEDQRFPIKSLDSLLETNFPPIRWVVQDLIPSEGITIISAAPGSFKTWLMMEIALSVAQGGKTFGRYLTSKTKVLIVDEESGPRLLHERFKRLSAPKGTAISYLSRTGEKVDEAYINRLINICKENGIGFVIFDSLVRFHRGDENASKDMAELLDQFKRLADNSIAVLIAHHNRKSLQGASSSSADMRGSSDILAAIDCHIALVRRNNDDCVDVVQTKNRYMQEIKSFKLRFVSDIDTSTFLFEKEQPSKKDVNESLKHKILNHLEKGTRPTRKDLKDELAGNGVELTISKLKSLTDELVESGLIKIIAGHRNSSHYVIRTQGDDGNA
jgi:RecA-family ATPase